MKPIISNNIRIRHPQFFKVGDHSIVDDFCYFSTKAQIGKFSHIASNCSVAGGVNHQFQLGDYSGLSSGVRIWCASNNFTNDLVTIIPPEIEDIQTSEIAGDVIFGNYTGVGSNSIVMPNNEIPEGTVIGALSFVPPNFNFKPWSVYFGNPIRYALPRNRDSVLKQVEQIEKYFNKLK